MTVIPNALRWLSEWATVIAPIGGAAWALWRLVVLPRWVRPALARRRARFERDRAIDAALEKIDKVYTALQPNGGSSLVDQVKEIHRLVAIADARTIVAVDEVHKPMFEADENGLNVRINRAFEDVFGYPPGEMLGKGWKRIFHPEDRDRLSDDYKYAVSDARVCDTIGRFVSRSGTVYHFRMIVEPRRRATDARRWFGRLEPVTVTPPAASVGTPA